MGFVKEMELIKAEGADFINLSSASFYNKSQEQWILNISDNKIYIGVFERPIWVAPLKTKILGRKKTVSELLVFMSPMEEAEIIGELAEALVKIHAAKKLTILADGKPIEIDLKKYLPEDADVNLGEYDFEEQDNEPEAHSKILRFVG